VEGLVGGPPPSTMALKARSPNVAMTTSPLSQAQTARLLAAECYRLKSEDALLDGKYGILRDLRDAEERVHIAAAPTHSQILLSFVCRPYYHTARHDELSLEIEATLDKMGEGRRQLVRLGNEGLSQASVSALDTMTIVERRSITDALKPQEFKDGAVLIKQGEPRDALLIIVQGQVSCAQRRGHRCEVGPARAALLERLSASARQGPGAPPGRAVHRGARPRVTRSATKGPWRLAASSAANRATQAPILRTYTTGPAWTRPCSSETAC